MREITADDIYEHLMSSVSDEQLRDQETDEVLGIFDLRPDDTIHVNEPDVYPTRILGRFRVHVEKVED
ncbi:hypothetical protein ACG83_10510 [Frankia sp. R43]|uniref:hypothetical protein n=1 Tax=Frankia sp. R43 TaxID=269536 RepID=UPI0006CA1359|nr:hypothetical protein [Frankia sp. R43]KPM55706.1 hypothetical protein ACG83_10510 [Frankia sp. R43]